MRELLERAKNVYFKLAVDRVFLGAVEIYCEGVGGFSRDLGALDVKSRGLRAFREYLMEYVGSVGFCNLATAVEELMSKLSRIKYCLRVKDNAVTARSSFDWSDGANSPISSENSVPPFTSSNRPVRRNAALVKAPFAWPNNSDSSRVSGIEAQFTLTKGPFDRSCASSVSRSDAETYQEKQLEDLSAQVCSHQY